MDKFEKTIQKTGRYSIKELDELFAELLPVTIDEMMGEWKITFLFTEGTGSKWETLARVFPIKLYSKKFLSKNSVKAWIFRIFGIKFGMPMTSAVLRTMKFRGRESTSMIYNFLPIIDSFRKIDNDTVMGIMEVRGRVSMYFYLKKLKN